MLVKIYTDGSARGNPDGPGGYGCVLHYTDGQGSCIHGNTAPVMKNDEQPDGADGGDRRAGSADPSMSGWNCIRILNISWMPLISTGSTAG